MDETKELLPDPLEKYWLDYSGIPVSEPIGLDKNVVKIGPLFITEAVRKKLLGRDGILYRHCKHDWEDVAESSWSMNDAAVKAL